MANRLLDHLAGAGIDAPGFGTAAPLIEKNPN